MIYGRGEKALGLALGLIVGAACMSMVVAVAHRVAEKPEPVPDLAAPAWRTDEPPAGEPIVGLWTDTGIRSHVVVMVYGAAYPYEPGINAIQAIEYNRPTMWALIP